MTRVQKRGRVTYDDAVIPELRKRFSYDPETGLITNHKTGKVYDKANAHGYTLIAVFECGRTSNGKPVKIRSHRLAWALHYGQWPCASLQMDHIDGNRTNNKVSNLRLVTNDENSKNRGLSKANTSGIQGIFWHKGASKWQVQIQVDGISKYFGLFEDKEEAARVAREVYQKLGFTDRHIGQEEEHD